MTVLDLDDFSLTNDSGGLLDRLRQVVPEVKVTLFTVPWPLTAQAEGVSLDRAVQWLRTFQADRPWVEYALHGYGHAYLECARWSAEATADVLAWADGTGLFTRVFKAPYWATGPGLYEGLLRCGWAVADHPKNEAARPPALRAYLLDRPGRIHGHVQDWGSNGLGELWDTYAALRGPFRFVSEALEEA